MSVLPPHADSGPQAVAAASRALLAGIDPALLDRLEVRLALVEERLRDAVASADALVGPATSHLAAAGGKRLRPLLTLLAAELGQADRPEVLDAAVVAELTHLASLYHDDVMDSAPMRRGAPSAHSLWGNSVAILAGDVLFARSSIIVGGLGPEAVQAQARTFERLCMGQLHELTGPGEQDDPFAFYLSVVSDKTASLLSMAARLGAHLAGVDPRVVAALGRYGEHVGVAFQLADDVIDLTGGSDVAGKAAGTDLREGVASLPVLLLRARVATAAAAESAQAQADRALLARVEGDLSDDADLAEVVALLAQHPVVDEARERARAYAAAAVRELDHVPSGPVRDALAMLARVLVDRDS